jgi:TatD DNase family protein
MLIDTHAHLNDARFESDLKKIIDELADNNLEKVINVGYDLASSKRVFELSQNNERLFAIVGVHPHDAKNYTEEFEIFAKSVADNKKVVAIGEIGLDYYHNLSTKPQQKDAFIKQLILANELKLPVVIHVRDAYGDTLEILQNNKHLLNSGGVMHCFSGSLEFAREVFKLGFVVSFGGPVTFTNSKIAQNVVKHLPMDKILLETDCPYLTPHPHRGTRNEPKYVGLVAKKIAEVFEISETELIAITNKNAKRVFSKLK